MSIRIKNIAFYLFIFGFAFFVFASKFGVSILDTSYTGWLYYPGSDMLPDIATWQYYRYSDYALPMGVFEGYASPQPIGIGNTNIIPWIAFPMHLLAPYLPEQFQYFGWFLLLCYVLQAYFGDRLLQLLGVENKLYRALGVIFLVISAPLLDRFVHLALCAHFLILASLCVYFNHQTFKKKLIQIMLISFFSALTHPYLILFPLAMGIPIFAKMMQKKQINVWQILWGNFFNILSVLFAFWISGVFTLGGSGAQASGFGYYSASSDTFFNSIDKTTFKFLSFKTFFDGQYEGYAYLGVGVLMLWLVILLQKSFYAYLLKSLKQHWILFVIVLALTVYAFGFQITFGNTQWAVPIYEHTFFYKVIAIFRSSGRYIWLLHQILLIFPIVFLYYNSKINKNWIYLLFSVALILQLVDFSNIIFTRSLDNYYKTEEGFTETKKILEKVDGTIHVFPAFRRKIFSDDDDLYFISALAPLQKKVTSGHLPRPNYHIQDSVRQLHENIINDAKWYLQQNDVILTSVEQAYNFAALLTSDSSLSIKQAGVYCIIYNTNEAAIDKVAHALPDFVVNSIKITDYLKQQSVTNNWLLITVKDEAASKLDEGFRTYLAGSKLGKIEPWHAYVGIWHKGKAVYENTAPELLQLDTIVLQQKLKLSSIPGVAQNVEQIYVNEQALSPNHRGINIVVLDSVMQVVESKNFDTYRTLFTKP